MINYYIPMLYSLIGKQFGSITFDLHIAFLGLSTLNKGILKNTSHNIMNNCLIFFLGLNLGFPGGSDSKEFTCNAGDLGSIP